MRRGVRWGREKIERERERETEVVRVKREMQKCSESVKEIEKRRDEEERKWERQTE